MTEKSEDKEEQELDSYEKGLLKEQEAQRKAAFEGTESPDPAEGVRAKRARAEAKEAKEAEKDADGNPDTPAG